MALPIGTRIGPYEITGVLGAGGMGEVYRARDARLGRDVALKVLPELFAADPERLARFQREAQVLAALKHPNIAAIYGLEDQALVLELVEGETLADRIARGPIPIDEALPVAKQIAEALQAAHEQGIIHRDLKPANIKIEPNGSVKVLDFGLAKLTEAGGASRAGGVGEGALARVSMSPTLTSPAATGLGVILGTAAYMSPEQAKGRPADKRSDVWAFGCVLFEMLTGKRAFDAEDVSDTLALVLKGEPDMKALPSDVPQSIRTLTRACLEKDSRKRVADVSSALFVLEHRSDLTEPIKTSAAPPSSLRRRMSLVAVIASSAAVAGAGVWLITRPVVPAVTRFLVAPPQDATFVTGNRPGTSVAISPDGRTLAFTAKNADGKVMLWLRPIDALTPQPLVGTDDAVFPFWSPDSRFIAYFTPDKLMKIAVAGGPPQTVAMVTNGRGGAWNQNGQIVYGGNGGPLFRVSSAGGQPSAVARLASGVQDHRFPAFLPDGRHVLYSATRTQGIVVEVASLDTGETRQLVDADAGALYDVRDGYLLFGRQGTLMAQSFDAKTLALSGEPFPIAERVESGVYAGIRAFSVSDTGILAYGIGSTRTGLRLAWVDRHGKLIGTTGPNGNYSGFDLAADGNHVAAVRAGQSSDDIWITDTARDTTSRLTFNAAEQNLSPIWSPDGTKIIFASFRGGKWGLYVKASNGAGGDDRLLESEAPVQPESWASDGQSIVYASADTKTRIDLWMLPLSGDRKPKPLVTTPFNENHGQISPDGKWLAYDSSETGATQVFVRPYPAGDSKWQISNGGAGFGPRWRSDGRELFYEAGGKLMSVDVKSSGSAFEAGTPTALFDSGLALLTGVGGRIGPHAYAVSADGQRFLIPRAAETLTLDSPPIAVVLNWAQGIQH